MSPRTGRPKIGEEKRDIKMQMRMNEEELKLLDECAASIKGTRSDVIRRGIYLVKAEMDEKK